MKVAGQRLVLHGWEMLQGTRLQILAALLSFRHVLGRSWAKVAREKGLCLRSEGKKKLRWEPSGRDRHLGEGDNWYKELESRS